MAVFAIRGDDQYAFRLHRTLAVERIEVYRGFSPVGLTPTSAAGVVNVVTKSGSNTFTTTPRCLCWC